MIGSPQKSPIKKREDDESDIWELSKEAAIDRIVELETELLEFQESSKDLEQALEDELHNLELANEKLEYKCTVAMDQLNSSNGKVKRLTQEVNRLTEENNNLNQRYEASVNELKTKLVSIEIANDNMETQDRVLESKLELATQFNNELLEKIAMIENDFEREKRKTLEIQLHLSNSQNEIRHLKLIHNKPLHYSNKHHQHQNQHLHQNQNQTQTQNNFSFISDCDEDGEVGNVSILSMRDILRAGPPVLRVSAIPKSDSLKKLHELTERSEVLSEKVQSFRSALVPGGLIKSPSTTHVSKRIFSEPLRTTTNINTTNRRARSRSGSGSGSKMRRARSSSRGSISPSPTIMNLAEISKGSNFDNIIKDSPVKAPIKPKLDTIEGSPAKPELMNDMQRRNSKKGSLLDSLKSMAI